MMLRIKRISAEVAWISLGQLMVVAGGIFGIRLLTYKLSPSIYGNVAIGMTAAILVQQIILGPLGQSFARYFAPAQEDGQLNAYIRVITFLLTKATILVAIIAFISIIGLFLAGRTKWIWLFSLAFLYSLFSGCNIALRCVQNAARQRKVVALHQGVGQWLHFLIPVGLIGLLGPYSVVIMLGFVIASLIILSSQLWFFKNKVATLATTMAEKVPADILHSYTKQIFVYAWPFATWGLFTWAQLASGRWALLSFTTAREVGLYSVLYQFGYYPIVIVAGLTAQLTTPVFFNRAGAGDDPARVANTVRLNNYLILAAGIATVIVVAFYSIFHKQIFSLLVAPEYRSVSSLLPLLVLSGGLLATGFMVNKMFLIKADTKALIYPKIVTAAVSIFLNYLGAYFYGLIGVVVAGIAFPLIYLVWIFILHIIHEKSIR